MTRIRLIYGRAATGDHAATLGQAAAGPPRRRDVSPHNRVVERLTVRCQAGDHAHCYSLHCTCPCGHGGGRAA